MVLLQEHVVDLSSLFLLRVVTSERCLHCSLAAARVLLLMCPALLLAEGVLAGLLAVRISTGKRVVDLTWHLKRLHGRKVLRTFVKKSAPLLL